MPKAKAKPAKRAKKPDDMPAGKPAWKMDDAFVVPLILALVSCLVLGFVFLGGGPKLPGTGAGTNNTPGTNASQNITPLTEQLKIISTTPYNGYVETNRDLCRNASGAVIVRMYALTTCPHCAWEEPIVRSTVSKFGNQAELRIYELNSARPSDSEMNMFYERSPRGGVPLVVLGCKYHRVGAAESAGTDVEKLAIERLICKELGTGAPSFCYVS